MRARLLQTTPISNAECSRCLTWDCHDIFDMSLTYQRTSYECGREDMGCLVDETTLPRNADRSQRVVAGDHLASEVSLAKSLDSGSRAGLQFILENDQTEESEPRFCLFTVRPHPSRDEALATNVLLTASASGHVAMIDLRCSFQRWRSLDILASCNTKEGRHSPEELEVLVMIRDLTRFQ